MSDNKRRIQSETAMERNFIAIVTNHDDDVYCFRKELMEELVHKGFEVLVICPYGEKLDLITNICFIHCAVAIDRRGTNPAKDIQLIWHYYRLLREYNPSAVLTYKVKPNIYASMAAWLLRIPYINNVTGLGSVISKKGILKPFIMNLLRIAFRQSHMVFFQNEENMYYAISH